MSNYRSFIFFKKNHAKVCYRNDITSMNNLILVFSLITTICLNAAYQKRREH